jgi:hypothetical protein
MENKSIFKAWTLNWVLLIIVFGKLIYNKSTKNVSQAESTLLDIRA